jgi:transmembrane sensor
MMKPDEQNPRAGGSDDLDWAAHAGVTQEVLAGLELRARRRRNRRFALGGVAALALLLVGGTWLQSLQTPNAGVELSASARTVAVTQPRVQTLPDGTVVELSEDAAIEVKFTDPVRRVELRRGAAHFAVRKNAARPFIVSANGIEVRAVGTAFAVDADHGAVEVVVTEGKVAVESPPAPQPEEHAASRLLASVSAGHRTVVQLAAPAASPVEGLDAEAMRARLAWRIPRLEFSATPLREVIAELNGRNRIQLVLLEDEIGDVLISGSLRADRLDALTELLSADFRIEAQREGDRITLRRR